MHSAVPFRMHVAKEKKEKGLLGKGQMGVDFSPGSSMQPVHSLSYERNPPGRL